METAPAKAHWAVLGLGKSHHDHDRETQVDAR